MKETQETRHFAETGQMRERWRKIRKLFEAASALAGRERDDFLRAAGAADTELRKEVEKLLAAFDGSESFLENPAVADAASLFENKATLVDEPATGGFDDGRFVAGTVLASRYRIITLLGRGGMGEVYKAEDIKLGQTVALKLLPDKLEKDAAALARFHAEVRTARHVSHPNVCRVFDIGEADGRHFLSMEFIDGDDLAALLRRIGRLPSERAVEIGRELCVGLAAIHNAGILHRDFKPANVIIDAKGKARITDFGIAGFAEDVARDNLRVGTPAYMSPEQIGGRDVTVKSDIYTLGLVLYEIFTGKQAFQADSIHELIRKHQNETPTNPSEYVKGIDPLVESVIGRCLEKNPADRPPSALHVAMALPGGNPMQIALDAGETPSPEMVAASPKKGALRPFVALVCAAGGLAMLGLLMFFSMKITAANRVPFGKPPEVLSERAGEIAARFGYTDAPVEKWHAFFGHDDYVNSVWNDPKSEKWSLIETGQPLVIAFFERQSPRHFDMIMSGNGLWGFESQVARETGQRTILLDTRGRLVEFSAVPPEFAVSSAPKTDFSPAFQAAELDPAKFREVPPDWTPPSACDERRAWEGPMPDHEEIPLRVEAAGFHGRIVSFRLIYPWTKPDVTITDSYTTRDWIATFLFAGLIVGVIVAACFLAWKNLKSGSGNRRGAFKLAFFVMIATFLGWFLSMSHVPALFPELDRFNHALREALRFSAIAWVVYLALEPIVRRHLPDLTVSWNRLLVGDWRDPLVGRDVLLGTLWGVAHLTLIYTGLSLEKVVYGDLRMMIQSRALTSLNSWPAMILSVAGEGTAWGFMIVCLLAISFLAVRRRFAAALVLFALVTTIETLFFTHSLAYLPFTLAISLLTCLVAGRLGLIATFVGQVVFMWLESTLLTLSFSAWHAGKMFLTLGLITLLLVYGFKISTASQR
ncbi:MAG: serine/threonine protein kinase [Acidobacteria bacterium]|nr:serine/threonine protein kinase [Acidobacteriota bacterium]